jgi:hypothetical protein
VAITTMDQLTSALAAAVGLNNKPGYNKSALAGTFAVGQLVSLWTAVGNPGAGAAQGTAAGAVPTSATAGALPFVNPASGLSYAGRAAAAADIIGTLILYDRLVHTSTLSGTVTTAQPVASAALTRPDANGANTELFLEVYSALGATPAAAATMSYTNQAGTAGQTTPAFAVPASAPAGLLIPIPLASGDSGVRAVASVTLGTSTTAAGNFGITIARRICELPVSAANVATLYDAFQVGLAQIYNSACLWAAFLIASGTAAPNIRTASATIAQG